jgi:hypothetical protein
MARVFDPDKLKTDCERCDVLCCIAFKLPYADYQKPAGVACKNLDAAKCRCTIHVDLARRGYDHCTEFDCRGAGVAVSSVFRTLGRTWITDPTIAHVEFQTFVITYYTVLRQLYPDLTFEYDVLKNYPKEIEPFVEAALDLLAVNFSEQA